MRRFFIVSIFLGELLLFLLAPANAIAARQKSSAPTIIPRSAWGANESLGVMTPEEEQALKDAAKSAPHGEPATPSERELQCDEIFRKYPAEFATLAKETTDENGRRLRWPRSYSKEVKLIVIHHTGEAANSTLPDLPGPEQVQAIYRMHTVTNGWGDIGYHYLIDTEGVIYEGRAGGHGVIGAHVYCANTGTIGIALIGNFQSKNPSEEQVKSLRRLIASLAKEYDIDLTKNVLFHGKKQPTVVGHRDIAPTACPGRRLQSLLTTIRRLVAAGDFTSPVLPTKNREDALENTHAIGLTPLGETKLLLPPRGTANLKLNFRAGPAGIPVGGQIAAVELSNRFINLFQIRRGSRVQTKNTILADKTLRADEEVTVLLTVLAPRQRGNYTMKIGEVTYRLDVR